MTNVPVSSTVWTTYFIKITRKTVVVVVPLVLGNDSNFSVIGAKPKGWCLGVLALNFSFASKSRQIKFFNLVETEMTKYSALLNEKNTIKRQAHCKPNTVHIRPKKYLVPKVHTKK